MIQIVGSPKLLYRAGPTALSRIRAGGLCPEDIRAVAGPASGPRWLVLAGIDRALLSDGWLRSSTERRLLLVGASAGAWRMMTYACADPLSAHTALLHGYIHQVFARRAAPHQVTGAYRRMLGEVFAAEDLRRIGEDPTRDVAIHVARVRGPAGWRARAAQLSAMVVAAALNAIGRRLLGLLFGRTLLHTRPGSFGPEFEGTLVRLDRDNLPAAALASGSVPLYMDPVRDIPGAPRGRYLDGGLTDYHLRQRYTDDDEGLTLFPHVQSEISAVWFDRYLRRRGPSGDALWSVLQICPTDEYVAGLPGGRLPDRDDFFRFVDDPEERIRRWAEVAARSDELGEELLSDLQSGRVAERVEPIARQLRDAEGP